MPEGQLQTLTWWLLLGAQPQAPMEHVFGKSGVAPQQSCMPTVPPDATHDAAGPVAPASLVPASLAPASLVPASLVPASLVPASLVPASSVPASLVPASLAPASLVPVSTIAASAGPASAEPPPSLEVVLLPQPAPTSARNDEKSVKEKMRVMGPSLRTAPSHASARSAVRGTCAAPYPAGRVG